MVGALLQLQQRHNAQVARENSTQESWLLRYTQVIIIEERKRVCLLLNKMTCELG